jgi:hypothetical protein
MDDANKPLGSPDNDDQQRNLLNLCRELNRLGARYIVVGSQAMQHHGAETPLPGIKFLMDGNPDNQRLVLQALETLPEKAAHELVGTDLREYTEVRVADSIEVDLATNLCGVDYADAEPQIEWGETNGIRIPYASLVLLWKTKQNHLEEDEADRSLLREKLRGILPEEELHSSPITEGTSEGFLGQIWRKIF